MIAVQNISKSYKKVKALNSVSFEVKKGELFGLIGPDGAGKTTLIRILTTVLLADEGEASVANFDVVKKYRDIRQCVGYMPGKFSLYQDLSIIENLTFFATIFGTTVEANYELIKDIYAQIEPFKHRKAGQLSGGMKQKLALSCALIHKPKVLFLDEPTTGVDAVSRQEFWGMLKKLKAKGITILVSTPYMDEASLCDRVALIEKGSVMTIDTPSHIVAQFKHPLYAVKSDNIYQLIQDLRDFEDTHSAFPFGEFIHLATRNPLEEAILMGYLQSKKHQNIIIKTTQPTIEDCFMDLMEG